MGISINGRIRPNGTFVIKSVPVPPPPEPGAGVAWTTAEGSLGTATEGQIFSRQLAATGQGSVSFALTVGSNLPPGLSLSPAGLISGTATSQIALQVYNFTVRATDTANQTAERAFTIQGDVIDLAWTTEEGSLGTATEAQAFSQQLAATGHGTVTFTLKDGTFPPGVGLAANGLISGTPNGGIAAQTYTVTITATDAANQEADRTFTILGAIKALTWSTAEGSLGTATEAVPFSQQLAASGHGTVSYTVKTGPLPPGLTLTDGVISGTPSDQILAQPYPVTITATDEGGQTADRTFTITGAVKALTWTTAAGSLGNLIDGQSASTQLAASGHGTVSYALQGSTLPPNLSLSASGLITGTVAAPSVTTIYPFTVRATDASGQNADRSFTYTVIVSSVSGESFDNTVLLLQAEGADNSTLVADSSQTGRTFNFAGTPLLSTDAAKTGSASLDIPSSSNVQYANDGAFTFGTSSFTVEFWFRPRGVGGVQILAGTASVTDQTGIMIGLNGTTLNYWYGAGSWAGNIAFGPTITNGTWYHVALVRDGTTIRTYVNGTAASTTTGISTSLTGASEWTWGGRSAGGGQWFNGYIDDGRVYRGLVKYTADFTAPTTAQPIGFSDPNWAYCILATPFETTMKDFSGRRTFSVNGTAKLSTAEKKYGTSSLRLATAGDRVLYPNHTDFDFGSNDFTVETWVRFDSVTAHQAIVSKRTDTTVNSPFLLWMVGGVFWGRLSTGSTNQISGGTAVANTWHHVALVRTGTILRLFVDGTQVNSMTITGTTAVTNTARLCVGANAENGNESVIGYLDDFRITRTAAYGADFTPAQATAARDETLDTFAAGTVLKLHMDGADQSTTITDSSTFANTVTAAGAAKLVTATKKYGTASLALDTLPSSYISIADNAVMELGGSDFTVETWFRTSTNLGGVAKSLLEKRATSSQFGSIALQVVADTLTFAMSTNGSSWQILAQNLSKFQIGTWVHVAVTRQGTTYRVFVNGVRYYEGAASGPLTNNSNPWLIGGGFSSGQVGFDGNIDEFRMTKGCRYTVNFEPPTQAFA